VLLLHAVLPRKAADAVIHLLVGPRMLTAVVPLTALGCLFGGLALFTQHLPPETAVLAVLTLFTVVQRACLIDMHLFRLLIHEFEVSLLSSCMS
jgi:hypothetical protein